MEFGAESAPTPADRLVGRCLDGAASPYFCRGRVLVRRHDGGVNQGHGPVQPPIGGGFALETGQQSVPNAGEVPAAEPTVHTLPGTRLHRQIAPGAPVADCWRMALSIRRRSWFGRPVAGRSGAAAERGVAIARPSIRGGSSGQSTALQTGSRRRWPACRSHRDVDILRRGANAGRRIEHCTGRGASPAHSRLEPEQGKPPGGRLTYVTGIERDSNSDRQNATHSPLPSLRIHGHCIGR